MFFCGPWHWFNLTMWPSNQKSLCILCIFIFLPWCHTLNLFPPMYLVSFFQLSYLFDHTFIVFFSPCYCILVTNRRVINQVWVFLVPNTFLEGGWHSPHVRFWILNICEHNLFLLVNSCIAQTTLIVQKEKSHPIPFQMLKECKIRSAPSLNAS